jgi:predicted DNA-binding transcriptional regulator YafY
MARIAVACLGIVRLADTSMPHRYTRVHRLLKILTLIQSGPGWGPQRLADECSVTVRTIHRDMDELKAVGVPWYFDSARNGYAIRRSFFLPPVHLSIEEALALAVLCEDVAGKEQIPLLRPAWRALVKLRSQLPESTLKDLGDMDRRIAIQTARAVPPDGVLDVYDKVQAAIASKKRLRCRYESNNGDDAEWFHFDPHVLFFGVRAWYTIGRHHGRAADGAPRCLKLNRFTALELTDQGFQIPDDFSLDNHLGNAWRMIRGTPDYDVEIWFDPEFANTITETQWHKTQEVEHHADGSATFRCTVSGLDEIVWWVLSMGPHCRVIKPEQLVERVREAACDVCSVYETPAQADSMHR